MSTLFAFLHHLAAFTLVGALAVEFVLVGTMRGGATLRVASVRQLAVTDAVLGAAAGILLVVGLLRVFYFEKGADYYFHSHAFLTKLGLFILVALLSIVPTREFFAWRRALKGRAGGRSRCEEAAPGAHDHPRRTRRGRRHPALRGDHGARRLGVARPASPK